MSEGCGSVHKVQYYETDQMGVVHHANYIRWFEEARVDWMERLGLSYARLEAQGIVSPVLEAHCQYKRSVRFGQRVRIVPTLTAYNGVKMRISYRVTDAEDGSLRATGETEHCFLDAQTGCPLRLKRSRPDLDALLNAHLQG